MNAPPPWGAGGDDLGLGDGPELGFGFGVGRRDLPLPLLPANQVVRSLVAPLVAKREHATNTTRRTVVAKPLTLTLPMSLFFFFFFTGERME